MIEKRRNTNPPLTSQLGFCVRCDGAVKDDGTGEPCLQLPLLGTWGIIKKLKKNCLGSFSTGVKKAKMAQFALRRKP